jgi:tRNA-uridine 2-sulfurtransferase
MPKKIMVAMSGGIDSSVAAVLLKNQKYEIIGATMKLAHSYSGTSDPSLDAQRVASTLGIRHIVIDMVETFQKKVINYFITEYENGRTPNPCVRCNQALKFGVLLEKAKEFGCECIATGHYAIANNGKLYRGKDYKKDQSYFLYVLYDGAIDRVMFPLGSMRKQEIRELAAHYHLPNASRKESQDICFITDNDYITFLRKQEDIHFQKGTIIDTSGNVLGEHNGIQFLTVGQRKGLGALGKRMYVKEIVPSRHTVVVGTEDEIVSKGAVINNLITSRDFSRYYSDMVDIQIRYCSKPVKGKVVDLSDSSLTIQFLEPVRAVSPGQSAVLYKEEMVLGGGIIECAV